MANNNDYHRVGVSKMDDVNSVGRKPLSVIRTGFLNSLVW